MVSTEEKPNDTKIQALQFHFTAEIDNDKLIIHAINPNPNEDLQYWVEKSPNQFMDFEEIKTIINQGHTKIVSIAQKNLKIKVGTTPFELTPKPKSQINDLKDRIKKIILNHSSLEKIVKQQNDELKDQKNLISELRNQVRLLNDKFETKITQTATTVSQHTDQLKKVNNQLSIINNKIQKIQYRLQWIQFPKDFYPPINEPIKSCKWSEQLKSKAITINKNVVTRTTPKTGQFEFCLLNASFSNTLKNKQSWAIKINKLTGLIWLGVCLKSKMQKYNFNSQNIDWYETGHGLYLIGSGGGCLSHSQKEFNYVSYKSFGFGKNDVIFIEYDGVNNKLRFNKNKVEYFELSIIAPPQNDAYHPCVGIWQSNQSVELILPQAQ